MNLIIERNAHWAFDPRNLGIPGLDIGPIGKRKLVAGCPFTGRAVVRVGSYYKTVGPRGSGTVYHSPVVYFIAKNVLRASCSYSNEDRKAVNQLIRDFIEFGMDGFKTGGAQ